MSRHEQMIYELNRVADLLQRLLDKLEKSDVQLQHGDDQYIPWGKFPKAFSDWRNYGSPERNRPETFGELFAFGRSKVKSGRLRSVGKTTLEKVDAVMESLGCGKRWRES
jgi:hypothetical protein